MVNLNKLCKYNVHNLSQLGGGFQYFFFFTPYLGKIPNLTHTFQRGWFNHQPDNQKLLLSSGGGGERYQMTAQARSSRIARIARIGRVARVPLEQQSWESGWRRGDSRLGTHKCELLISCVVSEAR